jgi:hypothetical protein
MTRRRSHPVHAGRQGSLAFGSAAASAFALAPSVGCRAHLLGGGIDGQGPQGLPCLNQVAQHEHGKLARVLSAQKLLRIVKLVIPARRRMQP